MPRGERQTTGTAQALLGAKQIAAGERASKRATVADYVKTGVGALKSVGDYLQQKQSLEQNQDKLNLEQSMFSAQYGDQGEQEATRERKRQLELAQTKSATATADLARQRGEAEIAEMQAGTEAKKEATRNIIIKTDADKFALEIDRQFAVPREEAELKKLKAGISHIIGQTDHLISIEDNAEVKLGLEKKRLTLLETRERREDAFKSASLKLSEEELKLRREEIDKKYDSKRMKLDEDFQRANTERLRAGTKEALSQAELNAQYQAAGGKENYLADLEEQRSAAKGAEGLGEISPTVFPMAKQAAADLKAGKKDTPAIRYTKTTDRLDVLAQGEGGRGIRKHEHDAAYLSGQTDPKHDSALMETITGRGFVEYAAKLERDTPKDYSLIVNNLADNWPGGRDGWTKAISDLQKRQSDLVAARGSFRWLESSLPEAKAGLEVITNLLRVTGDPSSKIRFIDDRQLQSMVLSTRGD
tara:strand:- start:7069 stop:8490 length:1422 start_codon:yes stop_codon:yes gene_type:complete